MSGESIKVCCRFRFEKFSEDKPFEEWDFIPEDATIKLRDKTWVYDSILPPEVTQEDMYDRVGKQTISDFTNGYNGTIFAYGQSGSGKTFSMLGPEEVTDSLAKDFKSVPEDVQKLYGITVRAVIQIFETINEGTANEVYNEKIKCLLTKKDDLKIREKPEGGMYVSDKEERPCLTPESIFECISTATRNRAVVSTNQNSRSSRSHTILMLVIDQVCVDGAKKTSLLNLVDLAGSERIAKTGVEGQALKEAQKINQSLSTLGMCIMALTTPGSKHIPFRNSKLTLLLKESLGGNSKTTLLCTASKLLTHTDESVQTLHFASRAKSIKNACKSNVTLGVKELQYLVDKMKKEILLLRGQLKTSGLIYRVANDSKVSVIIPNDAYEIEGQGVHEENNEQDVSEQKTMENDKQLINKAKLELRRKRESLANISEEEIILKYLELRAKYDNMMESAGNKIHELSTQVTNINPEAVLKSVANETNRRMTIVFDNKENELNLLREKLEKERKEFREKENNYLAEMKEVTNQKLMMEDQFNEMKNEKESMESFLELNNCDITSLTEKLEKKRNKYKMCKSERNVYNELNELKEKTIKELNLNLVESEKTIVELKITISKLNDIISATKNASILTTINEELYSKIKNLEINNLTYDKELKNLKEEKDNLAHEQSELKNMIESIKSANLELKHLKDKFEKESDELKKNILEIDKQKNKLKEDLEFEKKKMESFIKVMETEQSIKDKNLEDAEIKLREVKCELKVLQTSNGKLQRQLQELELDNTVLKKENQLKIQQNTTIKEKVEIKKSIFGVNLLKKTNNIFLKEAKQEAKKTYILSEELMKDKISELRKLRGNIVSMSPKTISSRSSISDLEMVDFTDEVSFRKQETMLIERENQHLVKKMTKEIVELENEKNI